MRLTRTRTAIGVGAMVATTALTVTLVAQAQGNDGTAGDEPGRSDTSAGSTATAAAANSATPAPPPDFLTPHELPPHDHSDWAAGEVTEGLPDALFCLDGAGLPADGSWHREYWTDLDTSAQQIVVRLADEAAAEELAGDLGEAAANCAADWLRDAPGSLAGWDDHGAIDAGDGGRLYAVHTAPPEAGTGISGFGIGRTGATVTVVEWRQMGGLEDVPVAELSESVGDALARLGS